MDIDTDTRWVSKLGRVVNWRHKHPRIIQSWSAMCPQNSTDGVGRVQMALYRLYMPCTLPRTTHWRAMPIGVQKLVNTSSINGNELVTTATSSRRPSVVLAIRLAAYKSPPALLYLDIRCRLQLSSQVMWSKHMAACQRRSLEPLGGRS